jgi:hypothetical protein
LLSGGLDRRSQRIVARLRRHDSQCAPIGLVWLWYGPALLVVCASGCSGKTRLAVSPVHGRVVYKGQGVPEAVVIFHPEGDTVEKLKKMRPFAYADGNGDFRLKTYVDDDGAPPGDYRVSIVAASSNAGAKPAKGEAATEAPTSPTTGIKIPPNITKKYANVETSGIRVTIHAGENNLEPFTL